MQEEQPKIKEEVIEQRYDISDDCVIDLETIEDDAPGSINNAEAQICNAPPAEQVKIKKEKLTAVAPKECSSSEESAPPRMREYHARQTLESKIAQWERDDRYYEQQEKEREEAAKAKQQEEAETQQVERMEIEEQEVQNVGSYLNVTDQLTNVAKENENKDSTNMLKDNQDALDEQNEINKSQSEEEQSSHQSEQMDESDDLFVSAAEDDNMDDEEENEDELEGNMNDSLVSMNDQDVEMQESNKHDVVQGQCSLSQRTANLIEDIQDQDMKINVSIR